MADRKHIEITAQGKLQTPVITRLKSSVRDWVAGVLCRALRWLYAEQEQDIVIYHR